MHSSHALDRYWVITSGTGRRCAPRHMRGHRGRGGWGAGFPGGGRGPRARRGDIRAAILALLAEQPRNGYQIMQELRERSGGEWNPSPGSIYPTLQQLTDEGLVTSTEVDGRPAYELTDAGREEAQSRSEQPAPWDAVSEGAVGGAADFHRALRQLAEAAAQAVRIGDEKQVTEVTRILADARKAIYKLLAADD